ncbi:MAG: VWA domain-containing protein, partial [Planctomycetaceae bacterium]|nr:VWA domain-containing protein [Planctomycetaceae bacterium]
HQAQAGISEQQWVVLLLDRSGSMEGQKLREAKQAAKAFIARRNPSCEIAIVTFEDQVQVTSGFQKASNLDWVIDGIQTGGSTALQDGVAEAISLLTGKQGRKAVLLMTDGLANASTMYPGPEGQARVIEWARQEGVTISTIGLGDNVDANYLDRFGETGGKALLSPTPQELVQAFHIQQDLLESELYFELESSLPPNGARRSLKAVLKMGSQSVDSPQTSYVGFGFMPLVRGNHLPFLWAVLGLLALPEFLQIVTGTLRTWNFRRSNVRCLGPGDMHLGKRDRNTSPDAPGFQVGEWVVQCPSCSRPHHTRSWRYNHCHCPQGDGGAGSICYARYLPTWLRRTLNWLSGPWRESENGPRFRCRCAGDKDGF